MPAELWRLNWGGAVYNSNSGGTAIEEWSCSVSMLSTGLVGLAGVTTACVGLVEALMLTGAYPTDDTVALEFIKLNQFDIGTGLQITDPTNVRFKSTGNRHSAGSYNRQPLQIACRISIDAGTRQRRARGGWYMPRPNWNVGPAGNVLGTLIDDVAASAKTFIDSINSITDGHWDVGVWSRAGASFTPSTRVRVGHIPDTQRRRRNELLELYSEQPIA